jgi:hypothetical protein
MAAPWQRRLWRAVAGRRRRWQSPVQVARCAFREAIVLDTAAIALVPNRGCQSLQPIWRDDGEFIERRAQGLSDAFQPVEATYGGYYVCGVGTLAAPSPDQPLIPQALQKGIEKQSFSAAFDQARTEFAQNGMVEAGIGQRQTQRVLPVDPPTHGISSLTVG